jgi:integrase
MTMPDFRSSLASALTDFVTAKRIEGFDYIASVKPLSRFDAFLCTQAYKEKSLNRQVIEKYIEDTVRLDLSADTRYTLLSSVRVFSRYLHLFDPGSHVLHELPVSRPCLPRWYLYSPDDMSALLRDLKNLSPAGSLRPHCFYALIGLLSVTGLRIGEALALNLGDLDTKRRLIFVRKGKFGKDRYASLHPTTTKAMEKYLLKRGALGSSGNNSPFFLDPSGKRLGYQQVAKTFYRAVKRCSIDRNAQKTPRLHDLRHTFACNCLLKWYQDGEDVNAKLPILATAMGHVNIHSTQVYLHISAQLHKKAAQRFHDSFSAVCNLTGRKS